MNSLQLVSKIRSKTDDLSNNISELLNAGHNFSSLDKELLKKQCLDLYELMLKLKTDNELLEEKNIRKTWEQIFPQSNPVSVEPAPKNIPNPAPNPVMETVPETKPITNPIVSVLPEPPAPKPVEPAPVEKANENISTDLPLLLDSIIAEENLVNDNVIEEPAEPTIEPIAKANNFRQVLEWADQSTETMDTLFRKVELEEELVTSEVELSVLVQEEKPESNEKQLHETTGFAEINIGKAVENKRIQYTVMPDKTEPLTVPLNSTFSGKEPTYNDKIAKNSPPVLVPLADKTIEAPIDNIKSAINLNKKISFVNELFKENVVEYAKAIDRLNNASDRNDAFRIHNELKHQYRWDNNHLLVQDLEILIKRRFS